MRTSPLGLPVYQIETSTSSDVDRSGPFEDFAEQAYGDQNQSTSVGAKEPSPPKADEAWSSLELFGIIFAAFILLAIALWFLDNLDERWERIRRRFRRWRNAGKGDRRVEFPIAKADELTSKNSDESNEDGAPFLESERKLADQQKNDGDSRGGNRPWGIKHSPAASQSQLVAAGAAPAALGLQTQDSKAVSYTHLTLPTIYSV